MGNQRDDTFLLENTKRSTSFLQQKIRLTIPVCILLIFVFVSSAIIVSFVSYYWIGESVCALRSEQGFVREIQAVDPPIKSRSKRDVSEEKKETPCFGFACCTTPLDPDRPWEKPRLPDRIQPVDYQLRLELYQLNQPTDTYSGDITIVVDVRTETADIILHALDLLYSEVTVTEHDKPDTTSITVECVIPFPATETLIIHLAEKLKVGTRYNLRIKFFQALSIHGTGIFEIQYNKDQYGIQ